MDHSIALAVLAAGAGSRFCDIRHKLQVGLPAAPDAPEESVASRSVRRAIAADLGPVLVVWGAVELDLADDVAAEVVRHHNPRWAEGQATSLGVAVDAARSLGAPSLVVGLADQPGVSTEAWRRVAAATSPIAVATYTGRRGNPVRLGAEIWNLLPTSGDEGARAVMRVRADLVGEVPCTGSPADIDTVEDLRRWQSN